MNEMQHSTSASDIEMYKRLKRLEKFDQQLQAKQKQGLKPKLVPGGSGIGGIYNNPVGNGVAFNSQDDSAMDLDELAKHLGIKVSSDG